MYVDEKMWARVHCIVLLNRLIVYGKVLSHWSFTGEYKNELYCPLCLEFMYSTGCTNPYFGTKPHIKCLESMYSTGCTNPYFGTRPHIKVS